MARNSFKCSVDHHRLKNVQFTNINFAFFIFAAYALTVVGVSFWRQFALRRKHLDIPNERSSHTEPTPRGGGVIIFIVTIVFLMFWALLTGSFNEIYPFLLAAGLIAVVSWLDDLFSLPSLLRFSVHTIAALIAVFGIGFFRLLELPFVSTVELPQIIGQFLTVLWIVGLTNAYNFMDGIDGIAGTQGLVAGIGWSVLGFLTGQPLHGILGGLLAATCAGFLWHNWHPAKIFMGDVGSAFLGFSLAILPVYATKKPETANIAAVLGILLVWTFVFDSVLTFLRRAIQRENVFSAHRSHLYQRLVINNYRHDTVTVLYGLLAVIGAVLAIYFSVHTEQMIVLIIPVILAGGLWSFVAMSRIKKAQ